MAQFPVADGEWPEWFLEALDVSPRMQRMTNSQLMRLLREWDYAVKSGACFMGSGVFPCSGVHKVRRP